MKNLAAATDPFAWMKDAVAVPTRMTDQEWRDWQHYRRPIESATVSFFPREFLHEYPVPDPIVEVHHQPKDWDQEWGNQWNNEWRAT